MPAPQLAPQARAALSGFGEPPVVLSKKSDRSHIRRRARSPSCALADVERRHVRMLMGERLPWTAELPLGTIRDAAIPTLVISGGHDEVYELLADCLVERLGDTAQRRVLAGPAIPVQRAPGANELFEDFWHSAAGSR